jgi:Lipocalin-like domain
MKVLRYGVFAMVVAISGFTPAQSVSKQVGDRGSAREKLIGAWHLVRIDAPGPDGRPVSVPQPKGMLIYTRDGHMSV